MTGGGTSGHVTPNIALLPRLKEAGYEIFYIGSENGMEKQLIEHEGIPYHAINTGKLRRYFSLKNITDIFRVMDGFRQARTILRRIRPDIVFSKGGFVSCPVVWAAWACKIPVVIHESDMTPGLTNKLSMPFAKKVCYAFPESGEHIPQNKGILTGIPIRQAILDGKESLGAKLCGFESAKPVLMVIGGSQGAARINQAVRDNLDALLKDFNICHICGDGNVDVKYESIRGYRQYEYVRDELPHLFALSDAVISRAGATTLFELLALKKPNLLIPLSKHASRGDQILNADSFKRQGFSMVVDEDELSGNSLIAGIKSVFDRKDEFKAAMGKSQFQNGTEEIIRMIEQYSKSGKQ